MMAMSTINVKTMKKPQNLFHDILERTEKDIGRFK